MGWAIRVLGVLGFGSWRGLAWYLVKHRENLPYFTFYMNIKKVKFGSQSWPIAMYFPCICLRDAERNIRIVGSPAESQSVSLPNTKPERYHYTELLSYVASFCGA
jgi:hypothetical protein